MLPFLHSLCGSANLGNLSQSAHNLANDAAELKVMMIRVLDSNKALAERMAILESMPWQHSLEVRQDQEAASACGQDTAAGPDDDSPEFYPLDGPKGHPAFAFEEDLSNSWVYQRSLVRGPRTFSIATSKRLTQVTQSWSVLSGTSLSQISNIAIQSLPIFRDDLKDNHLYDFGNVTHALRMRSPLGLAQETPPIIRGMPVIEALNSELHSSNSTFDTRSCRGGPETAGLPKINEESPGRSEFVLPELDFSVPMREMDSMFEDMSKAEDEATVFIPHQSSEIAPEATSPKVLTTSSTPSSPDWTHDTTISSFEILYIAASLFQFNICATKSEVGYPYLTYDVGTVSSTLREQNIY